MKIYPFGAKIIDSIDRYLDRTRRAWRKYRAGTYDGALETGIKKLEKYFILAGGLALTIGLIANTAWWPWRVRVIYHDPIVHVDWEKFISGLNDLDPNGDWKQALVEAGTSTSTQHLGWVDYRLQWYEDTEASKQYMRRLREQGGQRISQEMLNEWMISERLRNAKKVYAYRDVDTARKGFGETYNPYEPSRFIASLTQGGSPALLNLTPPTKGHTGTNYLIDVFYIVGNRIPDRLQRAHFFEALRAASTFFTPFEIRNDGLSPVANLKVAITSSDQEIVQEFLDMGAISRGDKMANLQILNIPTLPAHHLRAIVLKSSARALPSTEFFLQEIPIVTQLADYWVLILAIPLIVFFF